MISMSSIFPHLMHIHPSLDKQHLLPADGAGKRVLLVIGLISNLFSCLV